MNIVTEVQKHYARIGTIGHLWWRCRSAHSLSDCLDQTWTVMHEQGLCYDHSGPRSQITQPSILLLNHTYDFYMLQSLMNIAYLQTVVSCPLRIVCETTYCGLMPPPLSTLADRLNRDEIRISRTTDDRATKGHKLFCGIQQALRDGYCVVLFGDIDAIKPLRTLYKSILDEFPSIPKHVFHFENHNCDSFRGARVRCSSSGLLWTTDQIISYRHRVDARFGSRPQ